MKLTLIYSSSSVSTWLLILPKFACKYSSYLGDNFLSLFIFNFLAAYSNRNMLVDLLRFNEVSIIGSVKAQLNNLRLSPMMEEI